MKSAKITRCKKRNNLVPFWNRLHLEVWNEWPALLDPKRYNWVNLTLINVYFEWYRQWGQLELQVVILGFGFYLTYDLGETKLRKEIYKEVRRIKKGKAKLKVR